MKYGRELELQIVEFIERNTGPKDKDVPGYDIAAFFADTPGDRRNVEQALTRLVKKGELIEDRETDPNGLPHYHLPRS